MASKKPIGIPPRPWTVAESKGGNWYMYDANGKCVIVPNVAGTGKTQAELRSIYHLICTAVNAHYRAQLEEIEAWESFDAYKGGKG